MSYSPYPLTRKQYRGIIQPHRVGVFEGINTELNDLKKFPDGVTPDSLNWITGTEKDYIALRRGTYLLGKTRGTTTNGVTGLGVGTKPDGTQVPFFSSGRKVKYYDATLGDMVEVGTDLLPSAANGDEVSIYPYQNLAGNFVYLSSINSSVYKIHVSFPGNAVDQLMTDYKGYLKFGQSRSFLLNRKGSNGFTDKNGLYMSYVDAPTIATTPPITAVTSEVVGALGSKTYTHTLTQRTGVRTVFLITVTGSVAAGTETFIDDRNGNLTSNFGGTGKINYATGALSVTFSDTTITTNVTVDYYYEDATSKGVLDFSFANPRVAGSGRFFAQFDGGGDNNAIYPLGDVFYCFHSLKTWQVTIPSDDNDQGSTAATNLPFREKMGVTYPYSAFGGAEGIYFINNSNPNRPEVYALKLFTGATAANIAAPVLISPQLNLSSFVFDKAVIFEWGIYILMCFQQVKNGVADSFNTRTLIYNKKSKIWDLLDYPSSRLAEYMGTLISGDPLTDNVFTLFSGFDDDGEPIPNYWTSGSSNLGIPGQKRTNRMVVDGLIQSSQNIDVYLSYDGAAFTKVFKIQGTGTYVDSSKSIAVGSNTEGSKVVGGGQTVYANPFQVEFTINSPRYEYIRVKFVACVPAVDNDPAYLPGGGYAQINYYEYKDSRWKSSRSVPFRVNNA